MAARLRFIGWQLFGVCLVVFGIVHFRYATETAAMVPGWLPAGALFWAYATGVAHAAAGIAMISGVHRWLAAVLITAMFVVFSALVHVPLLVADPRGHLSWVMNAINLCLIGAAWAIADSIQVRKRPDASECA